MRGRVFDCCVDVVGGWEEDGVSEVSLGHCIASIFLSSSLRSHFDSKDVFQDLGIQFAPSCLVDLIRSPARGKENNLNNRVSAAKWSKVVVSRVSGSFHKYLDSSLIQLLTTLIAECRVRKGLSVSYE